MYIMSLVGTTPSKWQGNRLFLKKAIATNRDILGYGFGT